MRKKRRVQERVKDGVVCTPIRRAKQWLARSLLPTPAAGYGGSPHARRIPGLEKAGFRSTRLEGRMAHSDAHRLASHSSR